MIWGGVYFLATGDPKVGEALKRCIGPDGRPWRHPQLVGVDKTRTFSRDQWLGLCCYILRSGDKHTADAVYNFIRKQIPPNTTPGEKIGLLTPSALLTMGAVYGFHRWTRPTLYKKNRFSRYLDEQMAQRIASKADLDVTTHLMMLRMLIFSICGEMTGPYRKAIFTATNRDHDNYFYHYVFGRTHNIQANRDWAKHHLGILVRHWQPPGTHDTTWLWQHTKTKHKPCGHDLVALDAFLTHY